MKPKSKDVSKVDLSLPTESDNNQSRSMDVSPSTTLGDVKIDTNQQRSAPVVLAKPSDSLSIGKE